MAADDAAFERYFRENLAAVLQYVGHQIADPTLVEEVTQDCFVVALRRFDAAAPPSREWLFGVARNLLKKTYRRRARERALLGRLARERPSQVDAGEAPLAELLPELDDDSRRLLALYYLGGWSTAEIGVALGISAGAVQQRLSRARRAAERSLTGRSVERGSR